MNKQHFKRLWFKVGLPVFLLAVASGSWYWISRPETLFRTLEPEETGIYFTNTVDFGDSLSILDFEYMFNGGGVAVGDVNNDGLQDLYFTGNMHSSRLYLNQGNWKFKDVTEGAGVATSVWANGAVMVDINQDGYKDIYVCVGGNRNTPESRKANLLFINNRDNTFSEQAAKYGLADTGYGIQAAFLDYDRDGDQDMYLLRNAFVDYNRNVPRVKQKDGKAASTDKLFRNEGNNTFTDVSTQAGITIEGFGLGVSVSDINEDGWPDIYVSNDFITNDLVWINNQDGTFSNQARELLKHQTYNGMGNDLADINNDGLVDIAVLDMLPEDNRRWKLTSMGNNYDEFQNTLAKGYEPQYVRNTLQLNNGRGPGGQLAFSEVGLAAGMAATEWSWAPLFADYDNDGHKDLFITNGYPQDITNLDFIVYGSQAAVMGTPEANKKERVARLKALPGTQIHNYMYRNQGNLTFKNQSASWGMTAPAYANGAAYADLDNDGDLDLVVNNINAVATVQENRLLRPGGGGGRSHFLRIALKGPAQNSEGLGTKVVLRHQGKMQYQYFSPFRGYLSSVEPLLHFGLDTVQVADSVEVRWPDGRYQLLRQVKSNQVLVLDHAQAGPAPAPAKPQPFLFAPLSRESGLSYQHRENDFVDFKLQPLLPHLHSRGGPGLAVADVTGDGREDVYVGGATGQAGALLVQQPDGRFRRQPAAGIDSLGEEMGVLFFDADNDKDQDLYLARGGSEQLPGSALYRDQLYLNNGQGRFELSAGALPDLRESSASVVAADFDRDGDLDLVATGRLVAGSYPLAPRSFLLRNDSQPGRCRFSDVTSRLAPALSRAGMVSSALWSDYDNDGWVDLVLAGEFMPLRFFHNQQGKLREVTGQTGLGDTSGWWNSLASGDFDQDGDMDFVAGNLGLNSRYRASAKEPLCVHGSDYNKDGRLDPVLSYYNLGERFIFHSRDDLIDQINSMRGRFNSYQAYAEARFEDSFLPQELAPAYELCARHMESSYVENLGQGKFRLHRLPIEAQLSPMYGLLASDFDQDGKLDVLAVGNSYATEVATGRYDASVGWFLQGNGRGGFRAMPARQSGFVADQDGKSLAQLVTAEGRQLLLVGNNNGTLASYKGLQQKAWYRAQAQDAFALVSLRNGKKYRHEFSYGTSYLSQGSRSLPITKDMATLVVYDFSGHSKTVYPPSYAAIP